MKETGIWIGIGTGVLVLANLPDIQTDDTSAMSFTFSFEYIAGGAIFLLGIIISYGLKLINDIKAENKVEIKSLRDHVGTLYDKIHASNLELAKLEPTIKAMEETMSRLYGQLQIISGKIK